MKTYFTLTVAVLILTGCATSPLGRHQLVMLPQNQVDMMGAQAFLNMKQKLPIDQRPEANRYVVCVAEQRVREVGGNWEVAVFRDEAPNAFVLPGGKIGVNSGMLRVAENQDQLATVLAHDLSHVFSKHSNKWLSQELAVQQGLNVIQAVANPTTTTGMTMMGLLGVGAQYGILMPYSRMQESEADLVGQEVMARAGFDPRQSMDLWSNMQQAGGGQPVEFLSTHPSHATRIRDLERHLPKSMALYQAAQAAGKTPQCDRER